MSTSKAATPRFNPWLLFFCGPRRIIQSFGSGAAQFCVADGSSSPQEPCPEIVRSRVHIDFLSFDNSSLVECAGKSSVILQNMGRRNSLKMDDQVDSETLGPRKMKS